MNEYGKLLRITREKLGITIEQAEKETRISAKKLTALETMQKEAFPADTYLKGTLVLYARFLRLEPSNVLELLELNTLHEKPLEFDYLSLEKNKKKRRMKTLKKIVVCIVIVAIVIPIVFFRDNMTAMFHNIFSQSEKSVLSSLDKLEQISGLYERNFFEGEKIAIVGSSLTKEFTITSVNNAVISVGTSAIQLERNVPFQLDVDNDGSIDYLLIMREQNREDNSLLIRIDPRVNNQDLIRDTFQTDTVFPSVDSNAEIQNILSQKEKEAVNLSILFKEETYFRIVSNNALIIERRSRKNELYTTTFQDQATMYFANDANITLAVNKIPINIEKKVLPRVFDLLWVKEQDNEVLKLVPRP